MRSLGAAILTLGALLGGCGGEGGDFSTEDLPKLMLQPGDLPQGFVRFQAGAQTRTDQFPGAQSDPNRFGRQGGWKARYRRRGATPATRGAILIESRADVFERDDGATREFDAYTSRFGQVLTDSGTFAENLHPPSIGEETTGITFRQPGATTDIRYYAIAWRDGNVTASIIVNGFNGRLFPAEAFALARKQARRIAAER